MAQTIKNYVILLKHDGGPFQIKTSASSEEAAIQIVMKAESCPRNAIVNIMEIV
jgi:hypothetical protein